MRNPAIDSAVVVFPAPFGTRIAKISPSSTEKDTPSTTTLSSWLLTRPGHRPRSQTQQLPSKGPQKIEPIQGKSSFALRSTRRSPARMAGTVSIKWRDLGPADRGRSPLPSLCADQRTEPPPRAVSALTDVHITVSSPGLSIAVSCGREPYDQLTFIRERTGRQDARARIRRRRSPVHFGSTLLALISR